MSDEENAKNKQIGINQNLKKQIKSINEKARMSKADLEKAQRNLADIIRKKRVEENNVQEYSYFIKRNCR
jgi:hypothetical protein